METFDVGDRVTFREEASTEDSEGVVTALVHLGIGITAYVLVLDSEREGAIKWTVAPHELTKIS